jgi:ATP-dependent Lhr-like helicase
VIEWLTRDYALSSPAAEQIAAYLAQGKRCLGVVPTKETLVLERFFDETGGMQLVMHAPFGSRINRAWGLALRKKFCQGFNFELQAAATEEGIILSLGPSHSFPLEDVFRYLHSNTVRETLVQAVLDSPIFETRWRWTTTLALAVPRNRNGIRIPGALQRMYAEDLLQGVFPDAAACLDNIQGAREIPEHPLVDQAMRDSLEEAMDLPRLVEVLKRIQDGQIECLGRDTPEPSVFCHELLNSAVYTFLDDAPIDRGAQRGRPGRPRSGRDPPRAGGGVAERYDRGRAARCAVPRGLYPRERSRPRLAGAARNADRRRAGTVARSRHGALLGFSRALPGIQCGRAAGVDAGHPGAHPQGVDARRRGARAGSRPHGDFGPGDGARPGFGAGSR